MKKYEIHKPGWQQPVGWTATPLLDPETLEAEDCAYRRVDVREFNLSHAATLFLLQGASLKQLLSDVIVRAGSAEPDMYSLIFTTTPRIHLPPPKVDHFVLAHILERPVNVSPEQLLETLFMREMVRSF